MTDPDSTWLLFDFSDPAAVSEWHAIDDRVMGGISSSRLRHDLAGPAIFKGNVSLELDGSFSSIPKPMLSEGGAGACTHHSLTNSSCCAYAQY